MARYSRERIGQLIGASGSSRTNPERGRAFEDLACYLFDKVPGISIARRDALNEFASEEIDVAFWNERPRNGFYFLDHVIILECKNWSSPLSSSEVSWFDSKLKRRGLDFGVLVAANGITGISSDRSAAHQVVASALAEGRRIVVITIEEIVQLTSTDDLVVLIQEKLCELAVSGTLFN